MHPWWSSYSASWGQCRTSGCHPSSRPWPLHLPMDCMIFGWHQCPAFPGDRPSHHHTYEGVCVSNAPWRDLVCYIDSVFNEGGSTQVQIAARNRCSHLSSSFLACSCSALGHSPRPWTSRISRSQPFGGLQVNLTKVSSGRTTGGTWLAGTT